MALSMVKTCLRMFGVCAVALIGAACMPSPNAQSPASAAVEAPDAETTLNRRGVRESQKLLRQLGYKPGGVDGIVGPRTRTAVRAFQADLGVTPDGGLTEVLLEQLRTSASIQVAEPAPEPATPVKTTLSRREVRESQRLLRKLGYKPGGADGIVGRRTRAAVTAYQIDLRLPVDGALTPSLLEQLRTSATIAASQPTPAPSAEAMATETRASQ